MAIVDWLEQNIDDRIKYTTGGKEVHFNCPFCNEIRHRCYISLNNGQFYCHNCNTKGHIVKLIQFVEGVSFKRAEDILKNMQGSMIPTEVAKTIKDNLFIGNLESSIEKRAIPLPKEYVPLDPYKKNNYVIEKAIGYLNGRGITNKQIVNYKMGFCMSGDYANRVIIPITENGELTFWVARAISKEVKLKEKSPSNESYQISKSSVIFNISEAVKKYGSIVISEGIFDALSWGDIGVSLLGKSIYQDQIDTLLHYRPTLKEVFIALDYDARKDALKLADKLVNYFKVSMIWIPKELDDPNNCLVKMGRPYLYSLLENAEEYSEFTKLKALRS